MSESEGKGVASPREGLLHEDAEQGSSRRCEWHQPIKCRYRGRRHVRVHVHLHVHVHVQTFTR